MSVLYDPHGVDWPLGFIEVLVPGTPVRFTSLIDPTDLNAPENSNRTGATFEYTPRFQQMMIQGFKPDTHGMQPNAGYAYVVRKGGNRDDYGTIVKVLAPGETFFLASAPVVKDVFSPYRYYMDADNAHDGALITGLVF